MGNVLNNHTKKKHECRSDGYVLRGKYSIGVRGGFSEGEVLNVRLKNEHRLAPKPGKGTLSGGDGSLEERSW